MPPEEKPDSKGMWDVGQLFDHNLHMVAGKLKALGSLINGNATSEEEIFPKEDFFGLASMVWDVSDELNRIATEGFEMCRVLSGKQEQATGKGVSK